MQLLSAHDVPKEGLQLACRQSRLAAFLTMFVFAVVFCGGPILLIGKYQPGWLVTAPVIILVLLMLKVFAAEVINSFRSSNWVLRVTRSGLWINLRSYRSVGFPPAISAVFVPYDEIASVREWFEKWKEHRTLESAQYLEIELKAPVATEIRGGLAAEHQLRVERKYFGGAITTRSRITHFPVSIRGDNTLRIGWRSKRDGVVPNLADVMREIGRYVPLQEPVRLDHTDASRLSDEQVDDLILSRVQAGDSMGAIKLLRRHRGHNLTDAKRFIDELTAAS